MSLTKTEAQSVASAARAVTGSVDLESMARPFLELLHVVTTLDSTYLTEIHWDRGEQEIRYSKNAGAMTISEGLKVPWQDTVCRRALENGPRYTTNAPKEFGDTPVVEQLGMQTYISVPVTDHKDAILGTLCGASDQQVEVPEEVHAVMEMFARLIGDQWERDHEREDAERRADQAERQLKERTTLLATAEHQLKSPLAVIKGWSDLLEKNWERFPDDQRREGITVIARSSVSLADQLDELLRSARSAVLAAEVHPKFQCITPVLERVGQELKAISSNHTIDVSVPTDCSALVDTNALWQVLVHLVENAIKYSPDGGTVGILAESVGNEVLINVTDEGLGVPDDIDVFAAFSRSQEDRFNGIAGTGVGLHVVASLVDAMDGRVSATRNAGRGSTFAVWLPRVRPTPEAT